MLVGSNWKLESKVALTVSIFDHNVNNVNRPSNTLELLYHLIIHGPIMFEYIAGKINLRLGLIALSIYYLLLHTFFFIIVLSCVYLIMQTLFGETSVM